MQIICMQNAIPAFESHQNIPTWSVEQSNQAAKGFDLNLGNEGAKLSFMFSLCAFLINPSYTPQ